MAGIHAFLAESATGRHAAPLSPDGVSTMCRCTQPGRQPEISKVRHSIPSSAPAGGASAAQMPDQDVRQAGQEHCEPTCCLLPDV